MAKSWSATATTAGWSYSRRFADSLSLEGEGRGEGLPLMTAAVVGGGIAGLTVAYELAKRGHSVTVYEAAPGLGGQAGTFEVEGARLERFYHHLFMADLDMIDLANEIGLARKLLWVQPRMGLYHAGQVHEFGTPEKIGRAHV